MARRSQTDDFRFEGFENPNTTPVPDVVFDQFLSKLGEAELKALLYIIRRTFGFKKDRDPISFNQFLRGITTREGHVLDQGCGIKDRTTLSKALKSLEEKGIVQSEKGVDERGENVTTVYSLHFKNSQSQGVVGNSYHPSMNNPPPVVGSSYPQETVKQQTDINHSNLRKAAPKKKKLDAKGEGSQPSLPDPLTESAHKPQRLSQLKEPREESREEESPPTGSAPATSSRAPLQGLTRQYLNDARRKTDRQTNPQGLVSLASVLPQPLTPKRTYSEERQDLVNVIADLAREFRDEATLTESVSRAYNLMTRAGIKDIGVFTAKIYEARAITKERYGSIKRGRMPYFFSVLADICGQRPKSTFQSRAPS